MEVPWLRHRDLEVEMNMSLSTKEKRHSNQTWCRGDRNEYGWQAWRLQVLTWSVMVNSDFQVDSEIQNWEMGEGGIEPHLALMGSFEENAGGVPG